MLIPRIPPTPGVRHGLIVTVVLLLSATTIRSDQGECKAKLRDLITRLHMVPADDLARLRASGDIFEAALDLLREEEARGAQNDIVARLAMHIMLDEGDVRAREVFLPFLQLQDHSDKRHYEAVVYALRTGDPDGERWIRLRLESGTDQSERLSLVERAGMYGRASWLAYLRRFQIGPTEREAGIAYAIKKAIADLEAKFPTGEVTPSPDQGNGEGEAPANAAHRPINSMPENTVIPRRSDGNDRSNGTQEWGRCPSAVASLLAILLVLVVILFRTHRAGSR